MYLYLFALKQRETFQILIIYRLSCYYFTHLAHLGTNYVAHELKWVLVPLIYTVRACELMQTCSLSWHNMQDLMKMCKLACLSFDFLSTK